MFKEGKAEELVHSAVGALGFVGARVCLFHNMLNLVIRQNLLVEFSCTCCLSGGKYFRLERLCLITVDFSSLFGAYLVDLR